MGRKLNIAAFGGVNTANDPRIIPENIASDMLNVRVEGGYLLPRYGYRGLASAQANFSAVYGFAYMQGYNSTTETEEYVSAETISGNTRFYSKHVTTGASTEIKNGVASVNLNASEWVFSAHDGDAYFINPLNTAPVYRHTIGDATSLTAIAIPTAPAAAPSYIVSYGPGGTTDYTQFSWAGLDPTNSGELAVSGAATNTGSSLSADNTFKVRHTNTQVDSYFEVDLADITAGVADWTYNDNFYLTLKCEKSNFAIQGTSIRVEFRNNDGSPKTLTPNISSVRTLADGVGGAGSQHTVYFGWSDKTRADFDNVRYVRVYYRVTNTSSTVANNDLIVNKMVVGGVNMATVSPSTGMEIAYSYYYSAAGFESELSPSLFVANSILDGQVANATALGVHLELTMVASGDANVDNFRVYARAQGESEWHRIVTQVDSDLTYDFRSTIIEVNRQTEYTPSPFLYQNATAMFSYKGTAVWLYLGGSENVRFSRVGDAIRQYSTDDDVTDDSRGANFTLADNFGDEPLGGTRAGDTAFICGKLGVYAMFGDFPAQMTPPKRVSGSFGVAGKYAFTRWKDDNGVPGIVYVSRDGQVYFAIAGAGVGQDVGDNICLSTPIRTGDKSLKAWLLDGQPDLSLTDYSTAQVVVDEQQDALIVVMGKRALILRRPDITGARYWEPSEFTTAGSTVTFRYVSGSTKRRVRFMLSNGTINEWEFNSSTNQYITGLQKDGGLNAPQAFWRSKVFLGKNERVMFIKAYREDLHDLPVITDYCRRDGTGITVPVKDNSLGVRFPLDASGTEHSIKITINEDDSAYNRIEVEFSNAGNVRGA